MPNDEMINIFIDEIKELKADMSLIVSKLIKSKMESNNLFEQFGQMVDRIYGTAMTLGHKEIGEYTKAMKDVTYMASASDNENGKKKTLRQMIRYLELNDEICETLKEPEKSNVLNIKLRQEKSRVEILNKKEFYSVTKKSCD